MAVYGYTKNYKLIKPQFDTDTWHDYEYDNLDTIDAVLSAIFASGDWQGFWKTNTHYDAGGVVIDRVTDTMYKIMVEHTTSEATFAEEFAAHPTYYELWSPNNLAEDWAIKMDGIVSSTDYSSKAYAISSALIDNGSAKEWAINSGTIGTTGEYSAKKYATDAASSASTATAQASAASASATLSSQWAVSPTLVASTDYSSKSWATGSLNAGSAKDWAIKEGGQVGTTGKYSAKVYSLAAENHYEKARDWASKTNGQVESTDYSAKAYAISEGLISAGSAKEWSNKAKAWATSSTIVEDGKYGASYYALQAYNANVSAQNAKTRAQEWASKMDGQVASTDYSSKYYAGQAANSATAAQDALDNVHGLIATPIGTIFQSIYVDESMDIARQLNGQLISSTKFTGFRDWLDDVQTAIPNLFTTEVNWQAEKALSKFGQVGKFVIDDENHTIRLPAVVNPQGLLGLSGIGNLVSESLPNITGVVGLVVGNDQSGAFTGVSEGSRPTGTQSEYFRSTLDASRSSSAYQTNAPVQQEAVQYPYYIQVATGVEETLPAIREYKVNNSDFFGKSMYSDIAPENASYLASNGQYNARAVYPDYYDWVLENVNNGVKKFLNTQMYAYSPSGSGIVYTITSTTPKVGMTCYGWSDGSYSNKPISTITSVNQDGTFVASYQGTNYTFERNSAKDQSQCYPTDYDFVVNQNDQTFRLPLLNGEEDLPSDRYDTLTLPSSGTVFTAPANGFLILDKLSGGVEYAALVNSTTKLKSYQVVEASGREVVVCVQAKRGDQISPLYNLSGTTYNYRFIYAKGNGTLYYYVGDTVQDASLINAGAVLGQLSNKADIDLSNLSNGLANTICTTPATTTSTATSARPAVVVENYKNGASWYRVWSDGWIEQGGYLANIPTDTIGVAVSFLKPFSDTGYFSLPAWDQANYTAFAISNRTTTGMKIVNRTGTSGLACFWKACGY